jgi:hypothetical protein
MIELNLFKSIPPSQDEKILGQQRHSTRVYLILLLTTMSILILFTSLRMQTISKTHKMPTLAEFTKLYDQYPLTLNCPCSQPTLKYDQLILYIEPQYHEICSSEFVSPNWINVEFVKPPIEPIKTHDFRYQSQIHFQLLSTLCHTAKQIIKDNLESFYQTKFVSHQVLSRESFGIQVDLIMEQFMRTVPESFQHTLELIKANLELNQFIVPVNSIFFSNSVGAFSVLTLYSDFLSERPDCENTTSQGCRCFTLSIKDCYVKTKILDDHSNYTIPGMFHTWFPLHSLLMSTLECFYYELCLSRIKMFINTTVSSRNFTALKSSSKYYRNNSYDTIEVLANKLFIQFWINESSYELYYKQCHPLECQYTYRSRLSLMYMITTIIGLIGGLTVATRLVAPLIVKFVSKVRHYTTRRQRNNVVPAAEAISVKTGKKSKE